MVLLIALMAAFTADYFQNVRLGPIGATREWIASLRSGRSTATSSRQMSLLAHARLHTPVIPSVHIINVAFGQSPFSCENTSLKDAFLHQNRTWDSVTMVPKLVQYVIMAITLLVVAVPEGLPLAVSLTLAYSVRQRCVGRSS